MPLPALAAAALPWLKCSHLAACAGRRCKAACQHHANAWQAQLAFAPGLTAMSKPRASKAPASSAADSIWLRFSLLLEMGPACCLNWVLLASEVMHLTAAAHPNTAMARCAGSQVASMHPLRLLTAQPRWCCTCLTARNQAHLGSLSSLRCADVQAGPMGGVSVANRLWPGSCRPGVRLPARAPGSAGEQQHCSGIALSILPKILVRCQSARHSWAHDGPAIRVAGIELHT